MKMTLRVKRMLPKIHEAIDNKEDPVDIRKRFSLSPRLYEQIRNKHKEEKSDA